MAVVGNALHVVLHQVVRVGDVLSAQHGGISLIDQHQSPAAGIDHAGLLQGRQHIGGLLQDRFAAFQDHGDQLIVIVRRLFRLLQGVFRHDAGHGEDCAFLWLHDGFISHLRAFHQGFRKLQGGNFLNAVQRFGETAQQLAGDNAGVAARTFQGAFSQRVRRFVRPQEFFAVQFPGRRLHRQGHIRSRIAVGNRENVERVDSFAVLLEDRCPGHHHIP